MSRTDKDMPWWVRSSQWFEYHVCNEFSSYSWQKFIDECTLPVDKPAKITRDSATHWTRRSLRVVGCHWVLEMDERRSQLSYIGGKKQYRRDLFHKPQRRAVRDAARKVVQGDWEVEFPDGRSRSSVEWDLM